MSPIWLLLALACDPGTAQREHRIHVLADLSTHTLSEYAAFERETGLMSEAATAVCVAPTAAALRDAQTAWWAARAPYKRIELVQFGPIVDYPHRLGPLLDDWPANEPAIDTLVTSDLLLDPDSFKQMGSATRGMPVVEVLLWSVDSETLVDRRCAVLDGAAHDVHFNAQQLTAAWEEWVANQDTDATQAAIDEWVNRMTFAVEGIRSIKLGKPVGDSSGGSPLLDTLESRPSGRSLTDATDALEGVRRVWRDDSGTGIAALLDPDDPLIVQIDARFDAAITRLAALPEPLEQTILIQPEVIANAQEALMWLQVALQVDLTAALGVTLAFNDNDGD